MSKRKKISFKFDVVYFTSIIVETSVSDTCHTRDISCVSELHSHKLITFKFWIRNGVSISYIDRVHILLMLYR